MGCSTSLPDNVVQPSAFIGSVVQVNQHYEIPNQKARVYIQDGNLISKHNLEKFNTYCSVLMQDLHKAGEPKLKVIPGQFEIIKLRKYNDYAVFPGNLFASRRRAFDFPEIVKFEVEMRLKSTQQPGVRALICAKQVNVMGPLFATDHYPTITEIRKALGNAVEIMMP